MRLTHGLWFVIGTFLLVACSATPPDEEGDFDEGESATWTGEEETSPDPAMDEPEADPQAYGKGTAVPPPGFVECVEKCIDDYCEGLPYLMYIACAGGCGILCGADPNDEPGPAACLDEANAPTTSTL